MPQTLLAASFRGCIYDSVIDTIGATPIVRLLRLATTDQGVAAELLAKFEFFDPPASVKNRIGTATIADVEARGLIDADTVLIEPTSGDTGIALAFVCAAKGYKLILTLPESMSAKRRKLLALLGAKLELTSAAKGMKGAIARAEELARSLPKAIILQQFSNRARPAAAHRSPPPRKSGQIPKARSISWSAVSAPAAPSPAAPKCSRPRTRRSESSASSRKTTRGVLGRRGRAARGIQGLGPGFIPTTSSKTDLLDEIVQIATALATARLVARVSAGRAASPPAHRQRHRHRNRQVPGKRRQIVCRTLPSRRRC